MKIIKYGDNVELTSATQITPILPNGTYDVTFNPKQGIFLRERPGFSLPRKIYGDCSDFSKRCLQTYRSMGKGMAVLLSGPKGCGKTVTAKQIAMFAGMPTLCISTAMDHDALIGFLTRIPSKCVVFIDEFEKVYERREERNTMLSLLDGAFDNKHLFVMTSNDPEIGEFFINRPGRIRYHKKFQEFPKEALLEMINDQTKRGKIRTSLVKIVEKVGSMSPDGLQSIIEECLIHNETPDQFMEFFNVTTELGGRYHCRIRYDSWEVDPQKVNDQNRERIKRYETYKKEYNESTARMHEPTYRSFCKKVQKIATATNIRPFQTDEETGEVSLYLSYLRDENGNSMSNKQYEHEEIESIVHNKGRVFVTLKNKNTIEFEKAEHVNRSL